MNINFFPQKTTNILNDMFLPIQKREGFVHGENVNIPVYAYRYIGVKKDTDEYEKDLYNLDKGLYVFGELYLRITKALPHIFREDITCKVQSLWDKLNLETGEMLPSIDLFRQSDLFFENDIARNSTIEWLHYVLCMYKKNSQTANATILKNMCIKLSNWIYEFIPKLFSRFDMNFINTNDVYNPKVLFYGDIKEHEVYFLIFLSKIGVDVIYINQESDIKCISIDKINEYIYLKVLPETVAITGFPAYVPPTVNIVQGPEVYRFEKSYEELAKLSSSTVMIQVFDSSEQIIGTGSGVIIGEDGVIVTNYHVISGGLYYSVLFEGLEKNDINYETYSVLNTNRKKDLAFLKIHVSKIPVPLRKQSDIVRGQRVVAIGSPLGLMNTFSEGIISGIRKSEKYDYIQTTAPISPGSSGGALLNLYGELIGVTAAHFIDGQNINVAVPAKYILELLEQRQTIINREIINDYSIYKFQDTQITFDCIFSSLYDNYYKIAFYQCRKDSNDLVELIKNPTFCIALEEYYIMSIQNIAAKYGFSRYEVELGARNTMFSFSHARGKLIKKRMDIYT
ncbi:MAG TPA: hypothetical protein DEP72_08415 [Clostridiales bacterium]|nr:MAG: hypothetical protein A2Y18_08130 [Clostridiales bacterium GWD2_32_19]HCC08160.1 hypothetical protein [Clostridiales bacterium]